MLAAACLTLPAAPAAAHIFEVAVTDGNILDEGDGVPIDTLGAAQNLWVYVQADLQGGELCVVDADIDDPGTGALHCKRPAWGTRNRVANQAAGWILIEKPYLPAGQWRILGNGGDEPGDDVLSPEFTVQACTPGQCDRHFALEIAERYKARALDTADRLKDLGYGLTVAGNNTPSATGDEIVDAFKTYAVKPLYDHAPFLLRMGLDQGLSAGLDFIEGLAGSFWLGSLEGKMMALAKAINDRSEQMYRDIADDPPDPAYLAVAPATPDPPQIAVGDEALDAALVTIDRMAADGEAGLTAYERFQGAVADGSDVGQHLQARAMADFDFRLADEMRAGADAYDAIATRLQAEPRFAALAVTQEQLDLIGPALERVAAQGFLPAERDQLTTLGLDDAAIAALRDDLSDLSLHLADVPVGVPVVDLLRAAASELRDSVGAVDAMARNATAVAGSANQAPVARPAGPTAAVDPGTPVAFDGSASTDDIAIAEHAWSFDDGATATGAHASHAFTTSGAHTATLRVTDDDGIGAEASITVQVRSAKPAVVTRPSVSGTARDGDALTTDAGTWEPAPDTTVVQWQRCDTGGDHCEDVPGSTSAELTLTPGDVGHRMRALVTAANDGGSATAASDPTEAVVARPVTTTTTPTVAGIARAGETLTGTDGDYDGTPPIAVTRRWERCEAGDCLPIAGATGLTYELTAADAGHTVRLAVEATNAAGPHAAHSEPTDPIATADPPTNTQAPEVTGTPRDGEVLHADGGAWSRDALQLSFQWLRCTATGASCTPIAGATAPDRAAVSDDVGHRLAVRVEASDALGRASATSAPTAAVAAVAPSGGGAAIDGTPRVGATLVAFPGAWAGTSPIGLAHRWQRCAAGGTACEDIPGATGATYGVEADDLGLTLRVVVTATNVAGTASSESAPTAPVAAAPNAYLADAAWAIRDVIFGVPTPIGIAVGPDGDVYVGSYWDGIIWRFPPSGGTAQPARQVNRKPLATPMADLAFGKDGELYAMTVAGVVEVDRDNPDAPIARTVTPIAGLALETDPISGDLFFSAGGVLRIQDSYGSDPVVVPYGSAGSVDGLTFAPDGTLYGEDSSVVFSMSATDRGPVARRDIAYVPTVDGVAIDLGRDPAAPFRILANRNDGIVSLIDPSTDPATVTDVVTGATRGDFVAVGYDRCAYLTQSATVARLTNADGTCGFAPSAPDRTPPTSSASATGTANAAGWHRQAPTVVIDAADQPGGSGVRRIAWAATGAHVASGGADADHVQVPVGAAGVTTITFHATDRAGNAEAPRTITVRLDAGDPAIAVAHPVDGEQVAHGAAAVVGYSCSDPGGSGVASCSGTPADGAALDTTTLGPHSVSVRAVDVAGNERTVTTAYTVVDRTPPATVATPSSAADAAGWRTAPVTVGLQASDLATGTAAGRPGSGVARVTSTVDGGAPQDVPGDHAAVPITRDGVTTLRYHATDAEGNAEPERELVVRIDTRAPTARIDAPAEGEQLVQGTGRRVSAACSDEAGGSGLASCTGTGADGTPLDTAALGGHTVSLTATDGVGHTTTLTRRYVVVAPPAGAPPAAPAAAPVLATSEPTATPALGPVPSGAPAAAAAPAPLDAAAIFTLPSATRCVSRRSFRIRLQAPKGAKLADARVLVNGRQVKVLTGDRLTAPVVLAGLPAGRFTVRITARTTDGRTVTRERRYRTCAPKKRR